MNHWPFVIASYVLTIGGTIGLVAWSWLAMRRSEREAAGLGRRREA